jgi:hypothetical protein
MSEGNSAIKSVFGITSLSPSSSDSMLNMHFLVGVLVEMDTSKGLESIFFSSWLLRKGSFVPESTIAFNTGPS